MSVGPNADALARAINGDADALSTLLAEHGPVIRRHIAARLEQRYASLVDADDVMQVTYLEAFLRIRSFQPRAGGFEAWLQRIARHNLADILKGLRRAKRPPPERQVTVVGKDSSLSLLDQLNQTSSTPSRVLAADEAKDFMRALLDRLPDDYRQVIDFYELRGWDAQRVAQVIGRSTGAVYMLRARALDRLRELMGSESRWFSRGP